MRCIYIARRGSIILTLGAVVALMRLAQYVAERNRFRGATDRNSRDLTIQSRVSDGCVQISDSPTASSVKPHAAISRRAQIKLREAPGETRINLPSLNSGDTDSTKRRSTLTESLNCEPAASETSDIKIGAKLRYTRGVHQVELLMIKSNTVLGDFYNEEL